VEGARGLADRVDRLNRSVDVTVLDLRHDLATARATSGYRYQLFQLARIEGDWKIVNVLTAGSLPDSTGKAQLWDAAEQAVIQRTALDYIEGSFSGDADRMGNAVHPEINKTLLAKGRPSGKPFLHRMGASDLVEVTRAGLGTLEESQREIEVQIQDVWDDAAAARVISSAYIDHLQLAKFNGEWKIVNVLWVPNSGAEGKQI